MDAKTIKDALHEALDASVVQSDPISCEIDAWGLVTRIDAIIRMIPEGDTTDGKSKEENASD